MSELTKPSRFHYGWVIVACGALSLFSCLGLARFAYGMLLPGMREGLALGYDQMGFVSTGNFLGYLVAVALVPRLLRRFHPRATIAGGLLLIALCMFGISLSRGFWPLLGFYALIGIGSGLANIPVMVLVAHWFRRERRGRAAGTMIMGNGAAMIFAGLLIPQLGRLLGASGWRAGWLVLAVISLTASLLASLLLRNDPADLGLEPLGHREALTPAELAGADSPGGGRLLLQFGVLYFLFGATYMVYGTFIVTTMVVDFKFSEVQAGAFWALVGLFSMASGIGFGALSDRIGRGHGLLAVFVVQTLAYLLAGSGLGSGALLVTVVLYGCSAFAIPTIMAAAIGDYFGLVRAATAFATITVFFAIGQVLGPGAAGILAEHTGSFASSYLAAAALTGLAAGLCLLLPKPAEDLR